MFSRCAYSFLNIVLANAGFQRNPLRRQIDPVIDLGRIAEIVKQTS